MSVRAAVIGKEDYTCDVTFSKGVTWTDYSEPSEKCFRKRQGVVTLISLILFRGSSVELH